LAASDVDRYVIIRKLLNSTFITRLAFTCQWETKTYIGLLFITVTYTMYDIPYFVA
jgi:hypothetical protein